MDDLIAKKYALAILGRKDANSFYENLQGILGAFNEPKFSLILSSNEVKKDEKFNLISSFFTKPSKEFVNFLKILSVNSRLNLIPKITAELGKQRALKAQIYSGVVHSPKPLKKDDLANLEDKLSKKFKVKIELENEISTQKGVKIALDELGFQISFSMQDLEAKLSDYILKTL